MTRGAICFLCAYKTVGSPQEEPTACVFYLAYGGSKTVKCSEKLVPVYQLARRYIPDDNNLKDQNLNIVLLLLLLLLLHGTDSFLRM
jgi:hypothetical protein